MQIGWMEEGRGRKGHTREGAGTRAGGIYFCFWSSSNVGGGICKIEGLALTPTSDCQILATTPLLQDEMCGEDLHVLLLLTCYMMFMCLLFFHHQSCRGSLLCWSYLSRCSADLHMAQPNVLASRQALFLHGRVLRQSC